MGAPVPKFDADGSADAVVEQYDANGDGQLSEEEFADCYGLGHKFTQIDSNEDGNVSSEEIAERIHSWVATGLGATGVLCTVSLDGRPLEGATVTLRPAEFLGDAMLPAIGITDDRGRCNPSMDPTKLPKELSRIRGVQPGLYQVVITHDRKEIPPKYNAQTILGVEVSREAILPQGVRFDLKTK